MKNGFIKTACATILTKVCDIRHNKELIAQMIEKADAEKVNVLLFPELALTAYTAGDLFYSTLLLEEAKKALAELAADTREKYPIVIVGLPLKYQSKLYNAAAVIHNGEILGIAAKTYLPNYNEFYEMRQFTSAAELPTDATIQIGSKNIPFGRDLIFAHESLEDYRFAVEICEDLWAAHTPSEDLALAGANIIFNPSASDELIGKADYRRLLVKSTSARLLCGYVYANAPYTESTQDMVCSSHHLIAQNGSILVENAPFAENELVIADIDVQLLSSERHKNTSFHPRAPKRPIITFAQDVQETKLAHKPLANPFVPQNEQVLGERAAAILAVQSHGLAKRLDHAHAKSAVIGISGGIDSTLALLVAVRAMKILHRPMSDIIAVTMPCFGTTVRTKSNATKMCEHLGVTLFTIDITKAVRQHFSDIGHDEKITDVTYENSQARERTQILMDMANKYNALVIGTGDLSELALGWATYNGDHMSMYGVNVSVPKTLARYIIDYEAAQSDETLAAILNDILATPVSPELLPVDEKGEMTQKTEDLVGPYELHDFFLYHLLRFGFSPSKIYRLACLAYPEYDKSVILHWLEVFHRRFWTQQFKRSCLPDGPKVGSVSLSPRGDWRMPSDAVNHIWQEKIDKLKS